MNKAFRIIRLRGREGRKGPKDKKKKTMMQRDKGQRDTVSVWLRGRPDCFIMPDCSAGSDGLAHEHEHASFCFYLLVGVCKLFENHLGSEDTTENLWRDQESE